MGSAVVNVTDAIHLEVVSFFFFITSSYKQLTCTLKSFAYISFVLRPYVIFG